MDFITDAVSRTTAGTRMDRRGFLTFAAKGLVVAFAAPLAGRSGMANATAPAPGDLANAYVHIGTDGSITLSFGGAEMGQGSLSGLAQILAEELMVDWSQIGVQQSLVDPVVSYVTGGSSAVSGRYTRLRNAGAAARELLIAAAMTFTGDGNRDHYSASHAVVTYTPDGRTWPYHALAGLAGTQTVPADLRLTDPARFRLIGTRVPRVDLPVKVDGSAKYGLDAWFPGLVFAAIKHCPVIGGTLAGTPAKPSSAIAVVPCKASDTRGKVVAGTVNAVAVVASNTWLAMRLANSLNVSWSSPPSTGDVDSAQILAQARTLMTSGQPLVAEPAVPTGYTPTTFASAIDPIVANDLGVPTVDATYTLPYLAHATMEVLNCTVSVAYSGDVLQRCEIWAPTQGASMVSALAASLTGLPPSQIVVRTAFLGGGLGRKFELDYVSQAIQVALAIKRPVKLTWRREEDFAHDQYRPFALVNAKATLDSANRIKAWSYRNVSQAILGQRGWLPPGAVDSQAVEGAVRLPYALGSHVVEWVPLHAGIPVGFWRSVGASINAFAVESMMDELAAAARIDPFTFRYNHLTDDRARAVLWAADMMSSAWRNTLPAGHAWGVALAESFGTWVCQVVEISQPALGSMTVHRVACVIDCGTVINPDSVEAQMQGGIVHALNAALWGQTTFVAGKAQQQNFSTYRVLRPKEMPQISVQVIASTLPPSGVGEPGVPPLAPALANAYAQLTGTRVRTLPFFPGARMGGL